MGLAFMRFAWKIEPLASMADDDVVRLIGPTVQRYLDGDLRSVGDTQISLHRDTTRRPGRPRYF